MVKNRSNRSYKKTAKIHAIGNLINKVELPLRQQMFMQKVT